LTDDELKTFVNTPITDFTHFTGPGGIGRKNENGWAQCVQDDATEELKEAETSGEESDGIQLIRDCITAVNSQSEYGFFHNTMVPTTGKGNKVGGWGLFDAVLALPETQWSTFNFGHKSLTLREFCRMLKIRGIKRPPGDVVTINGQTVKGWDLRAFIGPAKDWCNIIIKNGVNKVEGVSDVRDGEVSTLLSTSPSTAIENKKESRDNMGKHSMSIQPGPIW
jgi:hypothetical protein